MAQLMLSSFSQKTISMTESTKSFLPWNNTILDRKIEYRGYSRELGEFEGIIKYQVIVRLLEALANTRHPKSYKKIKTPGYKLVITKTRPLKAKNGKATWFMKKNF